MCVFKNHLIMSSFLVHFMSTKKLLRKSEINQGRSTLREVLIIFGLRQAIMYHSYNILLFNEEQKYCLRRLPHLTGTLMGEGFMGGGGGVHPPLRSFLISDFVL